MIKKNITAVFVNPHYSPPLFSWFLVLLQFHCLATMSNYLPSWKASAHLGERSAQSLFLTEKVKRWTLVNSSPSGEAFLQSSSLKLLSRFMVKERKHHETTEREHVRNISQNLQVPAEFELWWGMFDTMRCDAAASAVSNNTTGSRHSRQSPRSLHSIYRFTNRISNTHLVTNDSSKVTKNQKWNKMFSSPNVTAQFDH